MCYTIDTIGGDCVEKMIVVKGHKILLETTEEHNQLFIRWCGIARWSYNYGLGQKKEAYEETRKSPGAYALMKEIVILKQSDEYAWLADAPKSIPRMALLQLETAYANFFRRVKEEAEKKGFPKFKSKRTAKMAFHLEPDAIKVDGNRVRIPKPGWLRMHQGIRWDGKIVGSVRVSKTAGKWYISFNVKVEIDDPIENQERVAVGLDVGIRSLAVLSDGKKFDNPRAFYRLERLLARAQRQMTGKQRGSNGWKKARLRVQCIHKRIADSRANATHQVSSYVAANYDGVAIEDLNIRGMSKNHHLAKSILDANFAELHRQLTYKMAWAGGEVKQVDRFFPSSKLYSVCGLINDELVLADREWTCKCGSHHDRDQNAATNLATKCFDDPGVDGSCAWRVKCSEAPYEARTSFEGRTKKGVLIKPAI